MPSFIELLDIMNTKCHYGHCVITYIFKVLVFNDLIVFNISIAHNILKVCNICHCIPVSS